MLNFILKNLKMKLPIKEVPKVHLEKDQQENIQTKKNNSNISPEKDLAVTEKERNDVFNSLIFINVLKI